MHLKSFGDHIFSRICGSGSNIHHGQYKFLQIFGGSAKKWLSVLGLPTQGLKYELIARLGREDATEERKSLNANDDTGKSLDAIEDSGVDQDDVSNHELHAADSNDPDNGPPATQEMSSENALQQHELIYIIRQLQAEVSAHRKFLQKTQPRGAAQQQQQQAVDNGGGNSGGANGNPSVGNPASLIVSRFQCES